MRQGEHYVPIMYSGWYVAADIFSELVYRALVEVELFESCCEESFE